MRFRAQVLLLIAFERTVDNLFAVVESLSSHFVSFLWKFARKSTEATAVAVAVAEAVATLVNVIVFNALRSAIPGLIAMRISRHSGQTGTLILIASHQCNSHTVSLGLRLRLQLGLGLGLSLFYLWESLSHLTSVFGCLLTHLHVFYMPLKVLLAPICHVTLSPFSLSRSSLHFSCLISSWRSIYYDSAGAVLRFNSIYLLV